MLSSFPLNTVHSHGVVRATAGPATWSGQAEVSAAAVVHRAVVVALGTLRQGCGDAIQPGLLVGVEGIRLFGNSQIDSHHRIRLPVCVVQILPVARHSKRILEPFEDLASAWLTGVQALCPVGACIHPAKLR